MSYILIIGFSAVKHIEKGYSSWSGKYLEDICKFSQMGELTVSNTAEAIAYLTGSANNEAECRLLKITSLNYNGKIFKVNYEAANTLDYDSAFIKDSLKYYFPDTELMQLPFCVAIRKEELDKIIDETAAAYKVKKMIAKNDWLGVYKLYSPVSDLKNKPHIWNNHNLLSELSFAVAKLSETYINLRQHFNNENEKNNFLKQQKKYRNEVIELRKRCIELQPKNPAYYSNLAYSYYQFSLELTTPGGRRDGNAAEEANKAIEYIDKALKLDPQRIPDLYRKGNLLSSLLPPLTMFGKKENNPKEQIFKARKFIEQGIDCFKKAEEIYQIMPVMENKMTKRYHKEYVKSLYDMARAYSELVISDWDITVYMFPLGTKLNKSSADAFKNADIKQIDNAIETLQKCITEDRRLNISAIKEMDYIFAAKFNGWCEGVNKLYSMGKFYFQKYWCLSSYGECENAEANYCRDESEKYLNEALKFPWLPEKQNQSKGFIAERLARVYISKKQYDKAINVLNKYIKPRTDYYIRYTYSAASILAGKYNTAAKQIDSALKYEKSNLELWLGYYLLGCNEFYNGDLRRSQEFIKKSAQLLEKTGKKNLDSILIAEAFINYKMKNKENALKCLEMAMKINPIRESINNRYQEWKS